jgi:RES domain
MAKLPVPPPRERLRAVGADLVADLVAVARHTHLVRVHDTVGEHVVPWDCLRRYGPVARCRFDPHDPPPHLQPSGVSYLSLDLPTALAERFQETRVVNRRRRGPQLTVFRPTRTIRLLDLTGEWPVRAGASHAINTARRDICRAWARTIVTAWPDLDGLWHTSSMTASPAVTLFDPAADVFPSHPVLSEPLSHPGLAPWLAEACLRIGYRLL